MSDYPQIMSNAKEDLAGNISGDFSPEDWTKILDRAAMELKTMEWPDVIRKFHREKFWGFLPDYKKPKPPLDEKNLGTKFIWFSARSFLITKTIILYAGARYTVDHENPLYTWLFFGALCFMPLSYGYFLWRHQKRKTH